MKKAGSPAALLLAAWLGVAFHETAVAAPAADTATKAAALGEKVPKHDALRDVRGNRRPLYDFSGRHAIVLAFLGADCPVSNLYLPGLIDLEKKYRSKDVLFLAIYPNEQEDLDAVAIHAHERDVPFLVLKDFGQKLADSVGVTRVPAVAVLDGQFALRYRGRIDDRYGVASRRPKASREDLVQALDQVLAGKPLAVAETEVDGCLLDRVRTLPVRTGVTYAKEVSRILQNRCQGCHRPEQTAPFALMNFEDAAKHGRMIKEVARQRRMPPWQADPHHGQFINNRRLTDKEVETLADWVDAGMPRGNDKDLPAPIDWPQGWKHKPDLVIRMPEDFQVPAEGTLDYQHYEVATNFTEDRWVQTAEGRPGSPGVVHHIVVYILPEGQRQPFAPDGTMSVLVGWAPGDMGLECPPDTALRVPKGSSLVFEMHYTPNGKPTKDRSSVGITFAKKPPQHELFVNFFANEAIALPPFEPHYRAEATLRLRADARILSFAPHMHWRGKDYLYEAIYPDGRRETLLSVPRWDFNWQNTYRLEKPLPLPKGARLHAVAHWDNSRNNPINPAPDKRVYWGLQTWDEMMVGWVAYVWERPETAAELAKQPVDPADLIFERMDHNGDGLITADELPEKWKAFLLLSGVKVPEKMTRAEFKVFFEDLRKKMPQKRPRGGANPKGDGNKPAEKPKSSQ
jgi:hypothetical protein